MSQETNFSEEATALDVEVKFLEESYPQFAGEKDALEDVVQSIALNYVFYGECEYHSEALDADFVFEDDQIWLVEYDETA